MRSARSRRPRLPPLVVAGTLPRAPERRVVVVPGQARSGIVRKRASAAVQPIAQGQRAGRWSVTRRAERVRRPPSPNSRRRSVLIVMIPASRPIRAVQRARLTLLWPRAGSRVSAGPGAR